MKNYMSALRTLFNAAAFAGLLALSTPLATAQDVQNIAAIVNDEIISAYDLDQRISLTMLMSNFPNTKEARQQLAKPTLTKLIDDRLKLQEAKLYNLTVSDEEVTAALDNFEKVINYRPAN